MTGPRGAVGLALGLVLLAAIPAWPAGQEMVPAGRMYQLALAKARDTDPRAGLVKATYSRGDRVLNFSRGEFIFYSPRLKQQKSQQTCLKVPFRQGAVGAVRKVSFESAVINFDPVPGRALEAALNAGLGEWWTSSSQAYLYVDLGPRSSFPVSGSSQWVWKLAGSGPGLAEDYEVYLDGQTLAVLRAGARQVDQRYRNLTEDQARQEVEETLDQAGSRTSSGQAAKGSSKTEAGQEGEELSAKEMYALARERAAGWERNGRLVQAEYRGGDRDLRFARGDFIFVSTKALANNKAEWLKIRIRNGRLESARQVRGDRYAHAAPDPLPDRALETALDGELGRWWNERPQAKVDLKIMPRTWYSGRLAGSGEWIWSVKAQESGRSEKYEVHLDGRTLAALSGQTGSSSQQNRTTQTNQSLPNEQLQRQLEQIQELLREYGPEND